MSEHVERRIEKWLKWVAILGPMISGLVFGTVGYVGGYQQAKQDITQATNRIDHLESWKQTQEEFDTKTVIALTRIKTLIKDTQ